MLEGFTPVPIDNFRGVYHRSTFPEEIPPNFAYDAENLVFQGAGVTRRPGITANITYNGAVGTPVRLHIYNKKAGIRFLLMDHLGKIFDISGGAPGTAILDFPSGVDFSVITMFDRAYITPHDRDMGLSSEKVYVYDGTTARAAAGTAPTTGLLAATGAAGNVFIGTHIVSFAFETDTGFITKYAAPVAYVAPGAKKIDLTSVDTGPAGTIRRHILISKAIVNYNGNVNSYELFFVDKIDDNAGTTITIDFFDSALVSSAKYLQDQLETIPASVFLCEHEGSLVTGGESGTTSPTAGTDTTIPIVIPGGGSRPLIIQRMPAVPIVNPTGSSMARISKSGNPESFNAVTGWVSINPDGGGLKNGRSFRGSLYLFKSNRTHVTWDNGGEPSTWPHQEIDSGQGTECFGIAELSTSKGFTQDTLLILNKNGLWKFNGSYGDRPLSWFISKTFYDPITQTSYVDSNAEVMISATDKRIYVNMQLAVSPIGSTKLLWVGDYDLGLAPETIRWLPSRFHLSGGSVPNLTSAKIVDDLVYIASADSNKLWKITGASDDGETISHYIDLNVPLPPTGAVYKLAGVVLALKAALANTSTVIVTAIDISDTQTTYTLPDVDVVRDQYYFAPIDLESEVIRVKVSLNTASNYFSLHRIIPYIKQVWGIRPL